HIAARDRFDAAAGIAAKAAEGVDQGAEGVGVYTALFRLNAVYRFIAAAAEGVERIEQAVVPDARREGVVFGAACRRVGPALDTEDLRPLLLADCREVDGEAAELQALLAFVRLDV